jgi:hypothetical protein
VTYGRIILPERDLQATIRRLTPMLTDPALAQKVDEASSNATMVSGDASPKSTMAPGDADMIDAVRPYKVTMEVAGKKKDITPVEKAVGTGNPMLAQVVGIIIGSPEYQRR